MLFISPLIIMRLDLGDSSWEHRLQLIAFSKFMVFELILKKSVITFNNGKFLYLKNISERKDGRKWKSLFLNVNKNQFFEL
jgi:hypothetical protein